MKDEASKAADARAKHEGNKKKEKKRENTNIMAALGGIALSVIAIILGRKNA